MAASEVKLVPPGRTYFGAQGFTYGAGVSSDTVGSGQICMNVLPMPAGTRAKAHQHDGIETIAYLLEGTCALYWGDRFEHRIEAKAGDHVFVPASVPHAPSNEGDAPCTWLVAHAAPHAQVNIVMLPDLDRVLDARLGAPEPAKDAVSV